MFFNTGLEYAATIRHLDFMEDRYGIHIERIRPEQNIISAVRQYGVPVLSKDFSAKVEGAQHGKEYAIKALATQRHFGSSKGYSRPQQALAAYLIDNGIAVSAKCCDAAKKAPSHRYIMDHHIDLCITGERQCEGGKRAQAIKSCYTESPHKRRDRIDVFRPLWFWNDETKQWYKEHEGVVFSDCYEVWGMKRTGCVGYPFNSRVASELERLKEYEPNMYRACINVFGDSYRAMDLCLSRTPKVFTNGGTTDD